MKSDEIRQRILDVVGRNGGHLASSLGAVEIAMALAKVFKPEQDRVIWDVGHQAYAWKLLTGRDERFDSLRKFGGLSGFPNPAESKADAAVAGHAGVAISTAAGFAAARDRRGGKEHVIAVVGDGALVNGVSFEALNNLASATSKLIVVLNDNEMSISRPAGSFAKILGRLITGVRYNRVKARWEQAGHAMKLTFLRGIYHRLESRIKSLFLGNAYFEQFGLRYIGPVDGHDLESLEAAFTVAKEDKRSVIVHVVTKKGKGFEPAERDPTRWHGVGAFAVDANQGQHAKDAKRSPGWSECFGRAIQDLAAQDERIVALTAGMTDGTGLTNFAKEFPRRFFDVGIAEEHMLAFAAGLAGNGLRPVVSVYSTFLQRGIDQVIHDIALPKLPVIICVDRAGVVGADGVTHQGIYDIALLRAIPNLTIAQPKDAADLRALLEEALSRPGPTVIRYPRGIPQTLDLELSTSNQQVHSSSTHAPIALWVTGDWYVKASEIAARVGNCEVVHARYLKPIDEQMLARQREAGRKIVSLENGCVLNGLGAAIGAEKRFGWPDEFIPHGSPAELERAYGLDIESIVKALNMI